MGILAHALCERKGDTPMSEEYSCYCEWDDGEMPEFYHERMCKARQEHKCCECGEPIKRGSRFQYATGKWDGKIEAYKTCAYCAALRDALIDRVLSGYGIAFGKLACVAMAYPEVEPMNE